MKCATWANGRRATHEQRKQKDLNELPPQFTQIFSFQYTQTLRSLSVTCKDAEKKRKLWINNFQETLSIMQRCAAILFSRLMKNQQCIPAREKLAAQSAPLAWPASLLRSTCSVLTSLAWEQKRAMCRFDGNKSDVHIPSNTNFCLLFSSCSVEEKVSVYAMSPTQKSQPSSCTHRNTWVQHS